MGRPKGSINKPTEAVTEPASEPKPSISKAQAVRNAMADGLDSIDDILGFVQSKYGLEIGRQQISLYKSQEKAKERTAAAPKTTTATPKNAPAPKIPTPVVSAMKHGGGGETDLITAMETLKPLIREHGGDRLRKIIDLLE